MRQTLSTLALITLCGWSTVSCSEQSRPETTVAPAASADSFIDLVQGTQQYMFEPFTPRMLLESSTVALHGTVQTVREGRIYDPGGALSYHVVLGIKPDEVLKDDPSRAGKLVFIELGRPDDVSATELAAKLPKGTEVALFASPGEDAGVPVRNPNAGRDPGASLYLPFPQGLWMASEDGFRCVLTTEEVDEGAWSGVNSWATLKEAALGPEGA